VGFLRYNHRWTQRALGFLFLLQVAFADTGLAAQGDAPAEDLRQIQQHIQQGDVAAARDRIHQTLRLFPRDFNLHNFLGVVEAQQANYEQAESSFKRAISLVPSNVGAYLNLGRLYQQNATKDPKALQKGLEIYRQLLRFHPANLEALYQSAVLLNLVQDFKESEAQLSLLPPEARESSQVLGLHCANQVGLGESQNAEETAQKLIASRDLTESDVLVILPLAASQQSLDLRQKLLEALNRRGLASSGALRQLGLVYERQGRLQAAREMLDKAAQGAANLVDLLLDLARVAHRQEDFKGALSYLAHARDLDSKNPGIHFFFGMVCIDLDLPLEAKKSLVEAVNLDPGNAYANYALGSVLLQDRDPSLAIPYFQKYCELKPNDVRGRFSLGVAHFYSNDFESAKKELGRTAANPETSAGSHYFLARVAKQENHLAEAMDHLKRSLSANPNYSEAYAELGLVHIRNKEYPQAERVLMRALELSPESYLANLNLLNLYQRTQDPRADEQAQRFEIVKKKQSERQQALLRTVEVRPY
jgi:tetratricopeptide (TPR) repeat protein